MKIGNTTDENYYREGDIIAIFGQAQLIRTRRGQYELIGGGREDQAEAREWISLFMHNAVIVQ